MDILNTLYQDKMKHLMIVGKLYSLNHYVNCKHAALPVLPKLCADKTSCNV